jgi:chromosome segregation ATPase
MTNLKAYVTSDSSGNIQVANMTELEAKDAKIEALENEVSELKDRLKSLNKELSAAERKAYRGLGD